MNATQLKWIIASLAALFGIAMFEAGMIAGNLIQQANYEQQIYLRDYHLRMCEMNSTILQTDETFDIKSMKEGDNIGIYEDSILPNGTKITKYKLLNTYDMGS